MKKIAVVLLFFALYGFLNETANPITATPEKITIGIQNNSVSAIPLIAYNNGYFGDNGLNVEIIPYPSGKLALQDMLNGKTDFCTCADVPVVFNSFFCNDYYLVATIASLENGAWITARKDKGINTIADLKGKRIATQKMSAVHYFLSTFLVYNSIKDSEVEIVYMTAEDMPEALEKGEIDAFAMRNPYSSKAKEALGENAIEFFSPGIYQQTFNVVARRDILERDPVIIKKILMALVRAENFIKNNRDEAVEIVVKQLGLLRESEIKNDWNTIDFELSLKQFLLITMEGQARWIIKKGFVDAKKMPNLLNYLYLDGLKENKPESVDVFE